MEDTALRLRHDICAAFCRWYYFSCYSHELDDLIRVRFRREQKNVRCLVACITNESGQVDRQPPLAYHTTYYICPYLPETLYEMHLVIVYVQVQWVLVFARDVKNMV